MASIPPNFATNPTRPDFNAVSLFPAPSSADFNDVGNSKLTNPILPPIISGSLDASVDASNAAATANIAASINSPVDNLTKNLDLPALAASLDTQVQKNYAALVAAEGITVNADPTAGKDLRVRLKVPGEYIQPGTPSAGPNNILTNNGGILFPYTPTISVDNKAEYAQQTPLHSNFSQYFYKNSSVGPINMTAKFTVQNEQDGKVLLSVIHLLRALTKMRFGADDQAGSPPPICRFYAYGQYMMYNVPVAITSWKHELPNDVDYVTIGRGTPLASMVPISSNITIDMNIMYSRREMLNHNIPDWLTGSFIGKGLI
jgi:hypothetical protein